jgi:fructokinase
MRAKRMIVVGGDNLIDLIQTGRDDISVKFDGLRGGSAYNTALAIGRQQAAIGYITPISNDSLGQFLAEEMKNSGVSILSPLLSEPTSLAVVTLNAEGVASYQFYRNDTAERQVTVASLTANFPQNAQVFHMASLGLVENPDADAWADFFCAPPHNVLRVLDPNVRPFLIKDREEYTARLMRMFQSVDLLKLSDEDLEWLYPDMSLDDAMTALVSKTSAAVVVLTRGGDGATAYGKDWVASVDASPVPNMVDTVGAGDTFMATLLTELAAKSMTARPDLEAMSQEYAIDWLRRAAHAASINCGRKGCNPPFLNELD